MSSPSTIDALVGLRVLMDEALRRASDPTAIGMHVSLVLLDGAVERALALALDSNGIRIHRNDGVEDLHGKACQEFPDWRKNGWQGVRQLHTARNAAQHQAIAPNFEQLNGWTADARAYIRSLVSEAFSVEVTTVSLASAITDSELREPMKRAEAALHSGDADLAADEALVAMAAAERKWQSEREDALGRDDHRRPFQRSNGEKDPAANLRKVVNPLPFVTDPGEQVWLESIRTARKRGAPVEPADAHRALGHVWGWIVRWQSFSASYLKGRQQRWHESFSVPVTDGDERPRIQSVDVSSAMRPPRPDLGDAGGPSHRENPRQFELVAQLVNVPSDDQHEVLRAIERETTNLLPDSRVSAHIDRSGCLRVRLAEDESDVVGEAIQLGLQAGLRSHAESLVSAAEEKDRLTKLAAPYKSLLDHLEVAPGVPAFDSIEARRHSPPRHDNDLDAIDLVALEGTSGAEAQAGILWSNALRQVFDDLMTGTVRGVAFKPEDVSPEEAVQHTERALELLRSWNAEISATQADAESAARAIARSVDDRIKALED